MCFTWLNHDQYFVFEKTLQHFTKKLPMTMCGSLAFLPPRISAKIECSLLAKSSNFNTLLMFDKLFRVFMLPVSKFE